MKPDLQKLEPYPFAKLKDLFDDVTPAPDKTPIALSIGEPQHESPAFVLQVIEDNLSRMAKYPTTAGMPELRSAIAGWLNNRFKLEHVDPGQQVLPVNGTREALFALAQTVIDPVPGAQVMCPNPFYQIYEGATLLAGATPYFINCSPDTGLLPDFDSVPKENWQRCQLLYLCTPGNPTGAVMSYDQLKTIIELSHEHNFIIASDECYSEIYPDDSAPPTGLLQACSQMGDPNFRNCISFHSLSKRSNLPGLRSGFVAGDADILKPFLQYRTYHGCAMPIHHQLASIAAWSDESHVRINRQRYREKFSHVLKALHGHLPVTQPDAGFYLWPQTPVSDTEFARGLYREEHLTVLPGRFLGREAHDLNPGENRVRMALVANLDDCIEAAHRITRYLSRL